MIWLRGHEADIAGPRYISFREMSAYITVERARRLASFLAANDIIGFMRLGSIFCRRQARSPYSLCPADTRSCRHPRRAAIISRLLEALSALVII